MVAIPNNSSSSSAASPALTATDWKGWKERGKQAYQRGDYASALQAYSQAAHRQRNSSNNQSRHNGFPPSTLDKQILLSNMVACRLKLGGAPQSEAAVAIAQRCIGLDDKWPKGHLRLAEAYLSLARAHRTSDGNKNARGGCSSYDSSSSSQIILECSDKACKALQKVIDLDPGNQSARDLLTKELRYQAVGSGAPEPSAPPEHMDVNHYAAAASGEEANLRRRRNASGNANSDTPRDDSVDGINIEDDDNINYNRNRNNNISSNNRNTLSWQERLAIKIQQISTWYRGLGEDGKTLVNVLLLIVILYVAFGGRFGLEYIGNNRTDAGSRRSNAVYEDFYRSRSGDQNGYHSSSRSSRGGSRSSHQQYDPYPDHRSSYSSSSSSWGSSLDGNYYGYVLLVGGVAYIAQRYLGISPYEALFFANMVLGRGRMPRRYWGGGGGWWGGRNRYQRYDHHPRGGMWWR